MLLKELQIAIWIWNLFISRVDSDYSKTDRSFFLISLQQDTFLKCRRALFALQNGLFPNKRKRQIASQTLIVANRPTTQAYPPERWRPNTHLLLAPYPNKKGAKTIDIQICHSLRFAGWRALICPPLGGSLTALRQTDGSEHDVVGSPIRMVLKCK